MINPLYVIYDDEMNLLQITSVKPDTNNFFITEKSKVRDFYLGFKSYPGHYVKHHGFNKFTIEEKTNTNGSYRYNDLIDVDVANYKTDLKIVYDKLECQWIFELDSDVIIESSYVGNILEFYLVKNDQHNFLIRTFSIKILDLIQSPVKFKFVSTYEEFFEKLLIKTKQHFDTIGINL